MSKITYLSTKTYIGVKELEFKPGKINIFSGPEGTGKTSVLEALEKAFTNKGRRTEQIMHGESEACLFVELDNGLSIDRRIRSDKADYFKLRKENEGVPQTQKYLDSFINGNIFRPADWVKLDPKEQAKSILNMLKINWSIEDIVEWFGEQTQGIEYNQHILMVLKAIETKYFKDREEINRKIDDLKGQLKGIKIQLPPNYDGEQWRDLKLQDFYKKVNEAQALNAEIERCKALQLGIEEKLHVIEATASNEQNGIEANYHDKKTDINDMIKVFQDNIKASQDKLANSDGTLSQTYQKLDNDYESELLALKKKYDNLKQIEKESMEDEKELLKASISKNESKIAARNQEILSLDPLMEQEIKNSQDRMNSEIEKAKLSAGQAEQFLTENKIVDIIPLQESADEVADNQTYLRQWDMYIDIRDNQLAIRERESFNLTAKIVKARELPQELLKTSQMPIDGIEVDSQGRVRINKTLIDGLSEGEQWKLAFKIASWMCGELKVICLDKFESLSPSTQKLAKEQMETDDFQYFITLVADTEDGDVSVERIGEI